MKVAFMISMKYGMRQFIYRDISAFKRKGHDVRIFTLYNKKGLFSPLPDWEVVKVDWLPLIFAQIVFLVSHPLLFFQLLGVALKTNSWVDLVIAISFARRMHDLDLIYSYFGDHKLFIGYYCKRITGVPLVTSIQAYELHKSPNPDMFKLSLAACDRIITISEFNKRVLVEKWGIPAENIDLVRHIVDVDAGNIAEKIKILIVGFFAEKKGHETLFKAIKHLNRPDLEVWVVGDLTPDVVGVDCRKLAKEIGVEQQVAFFGEQRGPALWALFRECDIFCLPSNTGHDNDHEGFPTVIAEAMAFGKPIVATRHAGIPEMVDDVYLADEKDFVTLAGILDRVADAPELRQRIGLKNQKLVKEMFSTANTERLEQILLQYSKVGAPAAGNQPQTKETQLVS